MWLASEMQKPLFSALKLKAVYLKSKLEKKHFFGSRKLKTAWFSSEKGKTVVGLNIGVIGWNQALV